MGEPVSSCAASRWLTTNIFVGQIYNAEDGGIYASSVSLSGADSLHVEGCVGALCGGETWTRVGQ